MTDRPIEREMLEASDEFLSALAALRAMEEEKRALTPEDTRRIGLAIDIEELSLGLLARSQYQTRLAEEALNGPLTDPRRANTVLVDWREAERRLRDAHLSVRRIGLESARLQDEYRRSVANAHDETT